MLQRIICLLAGGALAAVLMEVILHGLPYSTGYGTLAIDARQPVMLGTPHRHYTYSRDWSFHFANSGILNNEGFRAPYDYVADPAALVVIGNSFVQADALPPASRMTERLGAILQRKAYAVGIDGFSLADYLAATGWAMSKFRTHTVLVLLTTEDLVRSCQPRSGQHYLRYADGALTLHLIERPHPSLLKRLLNRSSLFRYLFDNLHAPANWVRGWKRETHTAPTTPLVPKAEPEVAAEAAAQAPVASHRKGCGTAQFQEAATNYLLDAFRQLEQANSSRVIFILAPDYWQRHTARAKVLGAFRDVDAFADRADQSGFEVVRLEEPFSATEDRGLPVSLMPIDRHWNAIANEVAAQTVADYMRARGQ